MRPGFVRPPELLEWEQVEPVGLEQSVMEGQVNIREAVLAFGKKLSEQYKVAQLILFGSRARGNYQPDSDADVALMLLGKPGDFVERLVRTSCPGIPGGKARCDVLRSASEGGVGFERGFDLALIM